MNSAASDFVFLLPGIRTCIPGMRPDKPRNTRDRSIANSLQSSTNSLTSQLLFFNFINTEGVISKQRRTIRKRPLRFTQVACFEDGVMPHRTAEKKTRKRLFVPVVQPNKRGDWNGKRNPNRRFPFLGQSDPAAIGALSFPHLGKLTFTPFRHCYQYV